MLSTPFRRPHPGEYWNPACWVGGAYVETGGVFTAVGNLVDHMDSVNVESWAGYRRFYNNRISPQFPQGIWLPAFIKHTHST